MKKLFAVVLFVLLIASAKAFAYNEADATAFYRVMPSLVQYYQIPSNFGSSNKIVFGNLNLLSGRACVGVKQFTYRDMMSATHISMATKLTEELDATIYTVATQITGGPTLLTHTTAIDFHTGRAGVGVILPLSKGGIAKVTARYTPKALASLTVFSTIDTKSGPNDSIIGVSYAVKRLPLIEISRSKNETTDIRLTATFADDRFLYNVGPYFQKAKGSSWEVGFMAGLIPTK